ncbi:MAG: ABC transporter ATP-binding protein/permease [Lachnospiraceae bacterium]|jgi:ABC-type bacteriocin/lantibiotic exporters, contain an N-terminal double-glycine peptidase domain|nr:ABC transporter ATP-binding protein [Lachnospiraceae bacterium]MCI9369804.1 ABC transporter ATP-binding protein [Lachnospiraceae bacterium]
MKQMSYIWKTVSIIYKENKLHLIAGIFLLLLVATFPFIKLVSINLLVDEISKEAFDYYRILVLILFFCVSLFISNSASFVNLLGSYLWITAEIALQNVIIKATAKKSLAFFDNADDCKKLDKAKEGYGSAVGVTMMFISTFFISFASFVMILSYLAQINPKMVLALLIIIPIKVLSSLKVMKETQKLRDEQTEDRMKVQKYASYITSKDSKIFMASDFFLKKWYHIYSKMVNKGNQVSNKNLLIDLFSNCVMYFCYAAIIYITIIYGNNDLGQMVVLFVAMETIFNNINAIVSQLCDLMQNTFLSNDLYNYIEDTSNERIEKCIDKEDGISLKEVTYSYANSSKKALKNITLNIKPKENIAIVGKNGAGKSTLIKLISGLYQPTSGSIKYGRNYGFSEESYDNISIMPQDVVLYNLTLGENIGISHMEQMGNSEKIKDILVNVFGINKFNKFNNGINTVIGKEFGGIDLSGGEKQRISYGRTLFRPHTMVFLDEPTAAVDPLTEEKIYQEFIEISKDKTTFFITHRLASVRFADRIIVMDEGRIVEQGTHNELMEMNGLYSEIYKLQKESF